MTGRLRLILPSAERLAIAAFCFLATQGCRLYAEWAQGAPLAPGEFVLLFGDRYLRYIGAAYGVFRVISLHPFYRPGYRAWLERTPWTSARPLPIGPVALVWEDAVVQIVLVLLALTVPGCDPVRVVALTLFGYLAALALTMAPTGEPSYAYLVAFGLGLMVRLFPRPEAMLGTGAVVYVMAYVGLRRSLARFPWRLGWQEAITMNTPLERYIQSHCPDPSGWPYDRLGPSTEERSRLGRLDALLLSMLFGWWLFAVEVLVPDRGSAIGLFAVLIPAGTFGLALSRLVLYTQGYVSPVSFWGRLWTFRWIVRGYDQVFIGPLCTLAICPLSIALFHRLGWDPLAFLPVTAAAVLFTALATPPRLRRWRLTGQHRIVPGLSNQKDFIKIG